jgi:predicted AAA+ superfamily ATPase
LNISLKEHFIRINYLYHANKKRLLEIHLPRGESAFLWGPRKVGKTCWISHTQSGAEIISMQLKLGSRQGRGRATSYVLADKT